MCHCVTVRCHPSIAGRPSDAAGRSGATAEGLDGDPVAQREHQAGRGIEPVGQVASWSVATRCQTGIRRLACADAETRTVWMH